MYNVLITLKLVYNSECTQNIIHVQRQEKSAEAQPCETSEYQEKSPNSLDIRLGRWDNRRLYKLYDNVIVGSKYQQLSDEYYTCLATQSSLEKLISLIEVTKYWSGPISAAIFAAGDEELQSLVAYITYLRHCFVNIRQNVAFHLGIPKSHLPTVNTFTFESRHEMDCDKPEATLEKLLKKVSGLRWRTRLPYPQNHLRNLARKNCQSEFVFVTDVDIIPSARLAEELDTFLKSYTCKGLCAYVIPTYELDNRVPFPPNKSELVRLANKGLARPFHHKVFIYNQYATNFTRWVINYY